MTTSDGCPAISPCCSRETAAAASSVELARARPMGSAARCVTTASTFASHVDHLVRGHRLARTNGGYGVERPGETLSRSTEDVDPNRRMGTDLARGDSEDGGKRSLLEEDATVLGPGVTLDPMVQVLGALLPRPSAVVPSPKPEPIVEQGATPIEQLMNRLVRRVAWSGNARTGTARLELGAGELEGATLTIHADDGLLRVALDLPPGVDREAWKARISGRLAVRGLHVEAVDVA